MISDLDDQQLSSMQSTSEFGDSRKELRQVECCVHGRPCTIASRLSRGKQEEVDREFSSGTYNLIESGYKSAFGKSESGSRVRDDMSRNLRKKVEREALDVPIRKWNFRRPHSSSSSHGSEVVREGEVQDMRLNNILIKDERIRRDVDRHSLSETVDAAFIGETKNQISSKEQYNEYEMMRPMGSSTIVVPPPMSTEYSVQTARIHDSVEVAPSVEAYIGVMSARQAEEYVIKPTSFKLYHMVEYGDPLAPQFFTLDALVNYYNVYVHLHEVDGECVADIFPISGMQQSRTLHRRVRPMLD
uniref:Uncharacterized protein n=1 Tax=Setaria digitata TaxID=48799 RepID=A0A915PGQ9_9BILA